MLLNERRIHIEIQRVSYVEAATVRSLGGGGLVLCLLCLRRNPEGVLNELESRNSCLGSKGVCLPGEYLV